jgi:hypothetical protein
MKSLLNTLSKNKRRLFYALLIGLLLWSVYKGNLFNSTWIMLTYCLSFLLAFFTLAPMLLPIDNSGEEKSRLVDLFVRFFIGDRLSFIVVREGKVVVPANKEKRKGKEKEKGPIEGPWVYGRGAILMDGTSVVVLKTETGISQVVGPGNKAEGKSPSGITFTLYPEQVDSVIDLRPQMRTEMIKAQTRDGILVDVRITAFFTLKGTKARRSIDMTPDKLHPFTWRQASVREVFHNKRIEVEGNQTQQTQWSDRVMQISIAELRQLIARHSLDYLTAPLLSDRHPRFELRRELLTIVQAQLDASNIIQSETEATGESKRGSGIEVRFLAVSLIWPPPEVVEQRIETWKKEWSKKEVEVMGRAKAQALIMKEQARATAQGELTARINDALQAAKDSGTTSSDLVALRFLEVMDKMAKDPTTRALLTLDSLNMLNQLRDMLKSDGSDKPA